MSTTAKTPAVGYIRVSTEEQATHGVSLEDQREKLRQYAALKDLDLVAVLADEGLSGKRADNRPAFQEALAMLSSGSAKALVVVKLDRMSRSVRDVLNIVERSGKEGWSVHSLSEDMNTGTAQGRFIVTMFAALAEMEREQISERVSSALAHTRSKGKKAGGLVPFGYDADDEGNLTPNAKEQSVIDIIKMLRKVGTSWNRIAGELNAMGHTTKNGKKWRHSQVQRALQQAGRPTAA